MGTTVELNEKIAVLDQDIEALRSEVASKRVELKMLVKEREALLLEAETTDMVAAMSNEDRERLAQALRVHAATSAEVFGDI